MMRVPVERARASSGVPRGFFLTFEGTEGSGKSTHVRLLQGALLERGYRVDVTREPGGTPLAEALRDLLLGTEGEVPVPETELFMLLACRAQHLQKRILPRLDAGEVVLCDRFSDASLAYQGGGRGMGIERVAAVNELATSGIGPDFTILFDVPVDETLARVGKRGREGGDVTRFDREFREFHEVVRDVYRALASREPERFVVLDATVPKPQLAAQVLEAVEPRLARRRAEGGLV